MPIVRIQMWPGRTKEQKAKLAKSITDAIVEVLELKPEYITIVFQEVPKENWAMGGVLATDLKQ